MDQESRLRLYFYTIFFHGILPRIIQIILFFQKFPQPEEYFNAYPGYLSTLF
jgi:hypothetical protein